MAAIENAKKKQREEEASMGVRKYDSDLELKRQKFIPILYFCLIYLGVYTIFFGDESRKYYYFLFISLYTCSLSFNNSFLLNFLFFILDIVGIVFFRGQNFIVSPIALGICREEMFQGKNFIENYQNYIKIFIFFFLSESCEEFFNFMFECGCLFLTLIFRNLFSEAEFKGKNDNLIKNSTQFVNMQDIRLETGMNVNRETITFEGNNECSNMNKQFFKYLDDFPSGVLICHMSHMSHMSHVGEKLNIIYANRIVKSVLKVDSTINGEQLKLKLEKFELLKEKQFYKGLCKNLYLDLNNRVSNSSYSGSVKYFDGEHTVIVKKSEIDGEDGGKYLLVSVESLTEERREMQRTMFKNITSQFLLTISHELNNPLNGLLLYCDKVSAENANLEKRQKYLEKLKTFKFSIKFFIKNLTLSSKLILKEKIKLNPQSLMLFNMINGVLSKFHLFYEGKKIHYTSFFKGCLGTSVFLDQDYFRLFLKNVFMFVCYKIENNKSFKIEAKLIKDKNVLVLNFFKQNSNKMIIKYLTSKKNKKDVDFSFGESVNIENSVRTEEMLREVLLSLANLLKIRVNNSAICGSHFLSIEMDVLAAGIQELDELNEFSPESVDKREANLRKVSREVGFYKNQMSSLNEDAQSLYSNLTEELDTSYIISNESVFKRGIYSTKRKCDLELNKLRMRKNQFRMTSLDQQKNNSFLKSSIDDRGILKLERLSHILKNQRSKSRPIRKVALEKFEERKPKTMKGFNSKKIFETISSEFKPKSMKMLNFNASSKLIFQRNNLKSRTHFDFLPNKINFEVHDQNEVEALHRRKHKVVSAKVEETQLEKTPKTPSARANCGCKRILVVDDESFNVNILKHLLKSYKLVPDTASNGQEALEKVIEQSKKKCCKFNYRLIFMDVMMPVMDGIEASRQIGEISEVQKLDGMNIIIISAHDANVIYNQTQGIKVIKEFVPKPVKKSKIEEILDKYFFEI